MNKPTIVKYELLTQKRTTFHTSGNDLIGSYEKEHILVRQIDKYKGTPSEEVINIMMKLHPLPWWTIISMNLLPTV